MRDSFVDRVAMLKLGTSASDSPKRACRTQAVGMRLLMMLLVSAAARTATAIDGCPAGAEESACQNDDFSLPDGAILPCCAKEGKCKDGYDYQAGSSKCGDRITTGGGNYKSTCCMRAGGAARVTTSTARTSAPASVTTGSGTTTTQAIETTTPAPSQSHVVSLESALVLLKGARPRFATVDSLTHRRETCAAASASFEATGGPAGNGHVSLNRAKSEYLAGGTHVLNVASRGGLTAISVLRFTGTEGSGERIFDVGNGPARDNWFLARVGTSNALSFGYEDPTGLLLDVRSGDVIVKDQWMMVVARYDASTRSGELRVDQSLVYSAAASASVPDITVQSTFVGKSHGSSDQLLNADIAGLIVVDEYLDLDLAASLAFNMTSGACPSKWWWCNISIPTPPSAPLACPAGSFEDHTRTCIGCELGKFHPWPIPDCQLP